MVGIVAFEASAVPCGFLWRVREPEVFVAAASRIHVNRMAGWQEGTVEKYSGVGSL
jgi:hypothetical protein